MFLKKLLRDIPSSVLVIVSIALIVFLGITSMDTIDKILIFNNYSGVGKYEGNYLITYENGIDNIDLAVKNSQENTNSVNILDSFLDNVKNNFEHYAIPTRLNVNNISLVCNVEVMYANDIMSEIYNLTGEYYSFKEDNIVIISENMTKYEENGYIKLGENTFKVIASVRSDEKCAFVFEKQMSESVHENILNTIKKQFSDEDGEKSIIIHCENDDNYYEVARVVDELNSSGLICSFDNIEYGNNNDFHDMYTFFVTIFLGLTYLFVLINCMSVFMLWLNRKNKELAVKRMFGWKREKIIDNVVEQLLGLTVIGVICGVIITGIYCVIAGERFTDFIHNMTDISLIVILIVVGLIVSLIRPIKSLIKEDPILMFSKR